MKKVCKKAVTLLLAFCLLITSFTFPTVTASLVEDENNVSGGTGNPDGLAKPGTANYNGTSQMWKISVYVAKKDTVTNASTYTLSEDYHKFGYTFWLYRDGYGLDQLTSAGVDTSKLLFELGNKEEYVNQGRGFTQTNYASVASRVFRGSDYGLKVEPNIVPIVNNFGADLSETKDFFEDNRVVSNALVTIAAKAAGTTVDALLKSLTFTINGETKSNWDLNMVDVRTRQIGENNTHTSCVSWVFLYEPVMVINASAVTGYYHAVTATGIAAAMKQGIYNFTSSEADYKGRFKETTPTKIPSVAWGLGTNFPMVSMPNSAFLSENWLGYKTGAYWQNYNGAKTWYVESQLAGGGFGLRYQRADLPTIVIKKTVDGASSGTLSGFEFTVKSNTTGETWVSKTDTNGEVTLYLPVGSYTVTETTRLGYEPLTAQSFTVPTTVTKDDIITVTINNTSIKTGTLNVYKVAEDNTHTGTQFTFADSSGTWNSFTVSLEGVNESFTLTSKDGKKSAGVSYTLTNTTLTDGSLAKKISVTGIPAATWKITETRPARYDKTYVNTSGTTKGTTVATSVTVTVAAGATKNVRFDNELPPKGAITIIKTSEDGKVSGVQFKVTGGSLGSNGVTVTTNANGIATLSEVEAGTYTVTELNVGSQYMPVGSQTLQLADGATITFNFENVLRKGTLNVFKVAEDNNYAGTSFTFTDTSGKYKSFTLGIGSLISSANFTVSSADGSHSVNLNLNVVDKVLSDGTSCRQLSLQNIPAGTWTVTENRPARYMFTYINTSVSAQGTTVSTSATVIITANTIKNLRFDNVLNKAHINVYKVSEDNLYTGTSFTFTDTSGKYKSFVYSIENAVSESFTLEALDGSHSLTCVAKTVDGTLADGTKYRMLRISNLPAGTYTVTESSPARYVFTYVGTDKDNVSTVQGSAIDVAIADQAASSVRFDNVLDKGTLNIFKYSEDNVYTDTSFTVSSGSYESFTFTLGETKSLTLKATDGSHEAEIYVKTVTKDGYVQAVVSKLPRGTYTVTESSRPDRYAVTYVGTDKNNRSETIGLSKTVSVYRSAGASGVNVRFDNVLEKGTLNVYKVAEDKNYAGVSFTVSSEKYESFMFSIGSAITEKDFTLKAKDGSHSVTCKVSTFDGTLADGSKTRRLTIKNLPAGTYTVTESSRPDRYSSTGVGTDKTTSPSSSGTSITVTVKNTATANARFDNLLNKANINVYKVAEDNTYTGTSFTFADTSGKYKNFTFSIGSAISAKNFTLTAADGTHTLTCTVATADGTLTDGTKYRLLRITNLPAGTWTVTESNRPTRYSNTCVGTDKTVRSSTSGMSINVSIANQATSNVRFDNILEKGTLNVYKVAEDKNYAGVSFTVSSENYESFTFSIGSAITEKDFTLKAKDGSHSVTCKVSTFDGALADGSKTRRLTIKNLPAGTWTVTESSRPDRYSNTYVGTDKTVRSSTSGTSLSLSVTSSTTKNVRFDNLLKKGSIQIYKTAEDNTYTGTSFTVSNGSCESFTVSIGDNKNVTVSAKDGSYNVTCKVSTSDYSAGKVITITGLPIGTYTVKENRPDRYTETYVSTSSSNKGALKLSESLSVTNGATKSLYFTNYLKLETELTIVKRIKVSEIHYPHGTPTFFITASANDGRKYTLIYEFTEEYVNEYLKNNKNAEYVEISKTLSDLGASIWTVTEKEVMRYRLKENGIEVRSGTATVKVETLTLTLSRTNKQVTAAFTNVKYNQSGTSANVLVINTFKKGAAS